MQFSFFRTTAVMNSKPKLRIISFLLLITVSLAVVTSSATQATAQQTIWKVGDRIEVQWQGDWYQAQVIEVKGSQYKIHYDGYASSWDEWIDKSRIRAVGVKQPQPNNPTQ